MPASSSLWPCGSSRIPSRPFRIAARLVVAALLCVLPLETIAAGPLDKTGTQWAPCLEWELPNPSYDGNPFDLVASVTFLHGESGEKRVTGMFYDGGKSWKFRFTGTRPGRWTFRTASDDPQLDGLTGEVTIRPNPDAYGFVTHAGEKWARPRGEAGELEAFVPQFVMYAHPGVYRGKPEMIEKDIATFFSGHGFNGFHTSVQCRWFDVEQPASSGIKSSDPNPDPRTFEALELLITKTHAAGGVVHIWAWGDESRRQTPKKWGINGKADRRLGRYIAARLGPLPGWTMGYGFDLWEWVNGEQLTEWHRHLHAHFGWPHMLGGRAHKNRLSQISESLDYSAYEQHRPDYAKYVETIAKRPKKPSFSEDRFRIRQSARYRDKDYNLEMTRRGLWHSTMAGGVANIWGNLQGNLAINWGDGGSLPYPNADLLKTSAEFFRGRFTLDLTRANNLTDGACLKRADNRGFLFYREEADSIRLDLSKMPAPQPAIAVDAKKPYREINIGPLPAKAQTWKAPYESDWAIAVGEFPQRGQ